MLRSHIALINLLYTLFHHRCLHCKTIPHNTGFLSKSANILPSCSILCRVCHGNPSNDDMSFAEQKHYLGDWILTHELRSALYLTLFIPVIPNDQWMPWIIQIIQSNIKLIRLIESFILKASMLRLVFHIVAPPNLQHFIDDIIHPSR